MTISGTGDAADRGGGFTVLELILVLSVIALLATVVIGASANLLRDRPTTPDEIFWKACQTARHDALMEEHDVRLLYDGKSKAFVVDDGGAARSLPIPRAPSDFSASLLVAGSGNAILVGGTLVQTQTVPYVTFFSDGTCSPFKVQFTVTGGAKVLSIDPWTCAPMLSPQEGSQ